MVFEGLKDRIKRAEEDRRAKAQADKEAGIEAARQAKGQSDIYNSTYMKTYSKEKNKATYKLAISQAQADARADAAGLHAQRTQPQSGGKLGSLAHALSTGASGFQKASKYGKTDPFGLGGGTSGGGTDFGLGSLMGGSSKRSSNSDPFGLGSLGLGEPERKAPRRKKKSSGKTITIHVK